MLLAFDNVCRGLTALVATRWPATWTREVLGEAVQTVMRAHGLREPYEQLTAPDRRDQWPRCLGSAWPPFTVK